MIDRQQKDGQARDRWSKSVVVLTGSIGSGKSTVAELLRQGGAFVLSADLLARQIIPEVLPQLIKEFGAEILTNQGELDRKRLAAIVFGDPAKRLALEQITHPAIQRIAQSEFITQQTTTPDRLLVYDCPLFFETSLKDLPFLAVVVVSCSEENALRRIIERDGCSREEALLRLRAQLPLSDKLRQATYVIDNNGTLEQLQSDVKQLISKLNGRLST